MSIPSDVELVNAAAATYSPGATPWFQPEGFTDRAFAIPRLDGSVIIAIEGTYNSPGWIGDFLAIGTRDTESTNHPTLGFVHADFYQAALRLMVPVETMARDRPTSICGHSRGAALAVMLAGLLIDDGVPLVKMGLFAPPRAGGSLFVKIATSIPFCAYKFGDDPVPEVPFTLLPDFPYEQVALTKVGMPLPDAFDCHAIENYVRAIHAVSSIPTA